MGDNFGSIGASDLQSDQNFSPNVFPEFICINSFLTSHVGQDTIIVFPKVIVDELFVIV